MGLMRAKLFPGCLAPQRPVGHLRLLLVTRTMSLPGHGRTCTVSCGVGALAFTRMLRQPVRECRTTEKCLSAWPEPRAALPLIIESASMSSSWGRNGTCPRDGREGHSDTRHRGATKGQRGQGGRGGGSGCIPH